MSNYELNILIFISAENDQRTSGFYAKPVSIGDFTKHCAQRRKYPVLLKLEFNNAIKEREIQPSRHGTRKVNIEKNQNPRVVPCKFIWQLGILVQVCYKELIITSTLLSIYHYISILFIWLLVDYNRVILEPEEGVPDSDYINASYVDVS